MSRAKPLMLSQRTGLTFLCVALISLIGFWLSDLAEDGQWAGRFGSVIILVGIGLLAIEYGKFGYLRNSTKVFDEKLKQGLDAMGERSVSEHPPFRQLNEAGEHARQKMLIINELTVLAVGTAQWGFGDLVANKLLVCGEWQC